MSDERKSFLVTLELEYACLAEDEEEARDFVKEAINDACLEEYCTVSCLNRIPDGWEPDYYIYHNQDGDIALQELLGKSEEYQLANARMQAIADRLKEKNK